MARRGAAAAILLRRCPRCRTGAVFAGLLRRDAVESARDPETLRPPSPHARRRSRFGWRASPALGMHERCPECGLAFVREHGYFYGAMYFSYALGVAAVAPLVVVGLLAGWDLALIGWSSAALLALLSPLLFQYSRVLWLWFDQRFDPR